MTASGPLTTRALNRAVLARQSLLERRAGDLPAMLRSTAFLQAQYAPSMYVGTWSRLAGFDRADITKGLADRALVQGTLLRSTIHLVAADDYWPTAVAIRAARRTSYDRATRGVPGDAVLQRAADTVRAALAGDSTLSQKQIDGLVGREARGGVGLWVDLVRVPPSGTWERRRADLYALAEDWLGPPPATLLADPTPGVDLLVTRYLQGFGPGTASEVADWAGLTRSDVQASLLRLGADELSSAGRHPLMDLPGLPLPDPEQPAPVRYLPTWDATLLVHCRRAQVLPEEHRGKVFSTKRPHSVGTYLVDGSVAGSWVLDGDRVVRTEFRPITRPERKMLDEEGERLAVFHA